MHGNSIACNLAPRNAQVHISDARFTDLAFIAFKCKNALMRTTLEIPDELMVEVKVEAARRKQKLNQLIPLLIESGLASMQSSSHRGAAPKTDMKAWLARMEKLGVEIECASADPRSLVEIVLQDRR
ncbi:MAG: hypothetical protein ACKVVP_10205 [Chloroflexota bacterium]